MESNIFDYDNIKKEEEEEEEYLKIEEEIISNDGLISENNDEITDSENDDIIIDDEIININEDSDIEKILEKKIQDKKLMKVKNVSRPFLTKYDLYPTTSIKQNNHKSTNIINFLAYSDGKNDLIDISKKINISFNKTKSIFNLLTKKKLIKTNNV